MPITRSRNTTGAPTPYTRTRSGARSQTNRTVSPQSPAARPSLFSRAASRIASVFGASSSTSKSTSTKIDAPINAAEQVSSSASRLGTTSKSDSESERKSLDEVAPRRSSSSSSSSSLTSTRPITGRPVPKHVPAPIAAPHESISASKPRRVYVAPVAGARKSLYSAKSLSEPKPVVIDLLDSPIQAQTPATAAIAASPTLETRLASPTPADAGVSLDVPSSSSCGLILSSLSPAFEADFAPSSSSTSYSLASSSSSSSKSKPSPSRPNKRRRTSSSSFSDENDDPSTSCSFAPSPAKKPRPNDAHPRLAQWSVLRDVLKNAVSVGSLWSAPAAPAADHIDDESVEGEDKESYEDMDLEEVISHPNRAYGYHEWFSHPSLTTHSDDDSDEGFTEPADPYSTHPSPRAEHQHGRRIEHDEARELALADPLGPIENWDAVPGFDEHAHDEADSDISSSDDDSSLRTKNCEEGVEEEEEEEEDESSEEESGDEKEPTPLEEVGLKYMLGMGMARCVKIKRKVCHANEEEAPSAKRARLSSEPAPAPALGPSRGLQLFDIELDLNPNLDSSPLASLPTIDPASNTKPARRSRTNKPRHRTHLPARSALRPRAVVLDGGITKSKPKSTSKSTSASAFQFSSPPTPSPTPEPKPTSKRVRLVPSARRVNIPFDAAYEAWKDTQHAPCNAEAFYASLNAHVVSVEDEDEDDPASFILLNGVPVAGLARCLATSAVGIKRSLRADGKSKHVSGRAEWEWAEELVQEIQARVAMRKVVVRRRMTGCAPLGAGLWGHDLRREMQVDGGREGRWWKKAGTGARAVRRRLGEWEAEGERTEEGRRVSRWRRSYEARHGGPDEVPDEEEVRRIAGRMLEEMIMIEEGEEEGEVYEEVEREFRRQEENSFAAIIARQASQSKEARQKMTMVAPAPLGAAFELK